MADAPRRKTKIAGQFSWRLIEMQESPAYAVLSLSAHRAMNRLEIELAHHGGDKGRENGRLIVTYDQFSATGIDRHAVSPALSELAALGFIEITEAGNDGEKRQRKPNKYRVTYRNGLKGAEPTNEWRKIKTIEQAQAIAKAARASVGKAKPQVGVFPRTGGGNPHLSANPQVGKTPTTSQVGKTHTTIDSSGGYRTEDEADPKAA